MSDTLYLETPDDGIFNNNLIKILEIETSEGNLLPLNDLNYSPNTTRLAVNSLTNITVGAFTPTFDTLSITPFDPVDILTIKYRAYFDRIIIGTDFDPETYEVDIPRTIKEALLCYVASRFFTGVNSQGAEGQPPPTITFKQLYETACKKIETYGLAIENSCETTVFDQNGWI